MLRLLSRSTKYVYRNIFKRHLDNSRSVEITTYVYNANNFGDTIIIGENT
jgi:hypothetical protein